MKTQPSTDKNHFSSFHKEIGHDIHSCEEFHYEVETMLVLGTLRVEKGVHSCDVNMMGTSEGQEETYRYQATKDGPPRLRLKIPGSQITPAPVNYQAQRYDYNKAHVAESLAVMKISSTGEVNFGGITRTGRCFTPEELRNDKAK